MERQTCLGVWEEVHLLLGGVAFSVCILAYILGKPAGSPLASQEFM